MKKKFYYYGLLVLLFNVQLINAQNSQTHSQRMSKQSKIQQLDKRHSANNRMSKSEYVEGEVLIKFKSEVDIPESYEKNSNSLLRSANASSPLQEAFSKLGVNKVKPLSISPKKDVESRNGTEVKSNCFKISFDTTVISTKDAIEYLKSLDEVLIAEPNYKRKAFNTSVSGVSNPLFSKQWAIKATRIDELWKVPTITDKRPVVAIIDSGLDTDHEELSGNLWTNEAELNGKPGVDDDGNGYVDDVMGYDMIWKTPNITDSLGHGTHCAGIVAAKDNKKGVVGMNPEALIMPVRVLDAEGSGETEDIIEGLNYAVINGADVISLSLGGPEFSEFEMLVFAEASKHAIVIAAAGNDESSIYGYAGLNFPGAYPSVLGVESSDSTNQLSEFSNWDEDGPFYSDITSGLETFNYELRAPGSDIISTLPYGYGVESGTSMATPCAAGIVSRLIQCKEYKDRQSLKLDLIKACESGCIDAMKAYQGHSKDDFSASLLTIKYTDEEGEELEDNVKLGSTIYAYPILVNPGNDANNLRISFTNAKNFSITDELIVVDHIASGDTIKVGPVVFNIPEEIEDDNYYDYEEISSDYLYGYPTIQFDIVTELEGETSTMNKKMHLYDSEHEDSEERYRIETIGHTTIISGYPDLEESLFIPEGDTLIIEPGTYLSLLSGVDLICEGKLICKGYSNSEEGKNYITINCENCGTISFNDTIEQVTLVDMYFEKDGFKGCHFKTCEFKKSSKFGDDACSAENGIFAQDCSFDYCKISCKAKHLFSNCKFYNSTLTKLVQTDTSKDAIKYLPNLSDIHNCNVYDNTFGTIPFSVAYYSDSSTISRTEEPSFLGSVYDSIVRRSILDAMNPTASFGEGILDISNKLNEPSASAPPTITHLYINNIEIVTEKLDNGFNVDEEFPIISSVRIVFSGPVYNKSWHISNAFNAKWESDSIFTADVHLGYGNLWGTFYDKEIFFDMYVNVNFNIKDENDEKLKYECLSDDSLKLTWEQIDVTDNDYIAVLVYGISLPMNDDLPLELELLDELPLDKTEIELDTKYKYAGYCIKLLNTNSEEVDIYNMTFIDCSEEWDYEYECEPLDIEFATAFEIMNHITGVTPIDEQKVKCYDVTSDNLVNIQDYINVYSTYQGKLETNVSTSNAVYSIEDSVLYVKSDYNISAIEAHFEADSKSNFEIQSGLTDMEHFICEQEDGDFQLLAYSFNGNKIPSGKQPLLKIHSGTQLKDVLVCDQNGNALTLSQVDSIIDQPTEAPSTLHYFNIAGCEVSPNTVNNCSGIYIQATERNGKLKDSKKFKVKK